jgi:hypothetical protein
MKSPTVGTAKSLFALDNRNSPDISEHLGLPISLSLRIQVAKVPIVESPTFSFHRPNHEFDAVSERSPS